MRVVLVAAVSLASAIAGAGTVHRVGWFRARGTSDSVLRPSLPSSSAPVARGPAVTPPHPTAVEVAEAPPQPPSTPFARAATPHAVSRDQRTTAAVADESALVVEAVRALRRDHDPRRAGSLAQDALQRYPHGAQVEEAMAVAMEAASAEEDTAASRSWAERYLGAFGSGRFADRARQILSSPQK